MVPIVDQAGLLGRSHEAAGRGPGGKNTGSGRESRSPSEGLQLGPHVLEGDGVHVRVTSALRAFCCHLHGLRAANTVVALALAQHAR